MKTMGLVASLLGLLLVVPFGCGSKSSSKKPPTVAVGGGSMTNDMGQGTSNGVACDASQVGSGVCANDNTGDSWLVYCNTDDTLWGVDCTANGTTCNDDGTTVACQ